MKKGKGGTFIIVFVLSLSVIMAGCNQAEKEREAQIKQKKKERAETIDRMESSFRGILQGSGYIFADVNLIEEEEFINFYFSFWKRMDKNELSKTIGACIAIVGEASKDENWKWGRVYFRYGDAYEGEKLGWITSYNCREALKHEDNPEQMRKIISENWHDWID